MKTLFRLLQNGGPNDVLEGKTSLRLKKFACSFMKSLKGFSSSDPFDFWLSCISPYKNIYSVITTNLCLFVYTPLQENFAAMSSTWRKRLIPWLKGLDWKALKSCFGRILWSLVEFCVSYREFFVRSSKLVNVLEATDNNGRKIDEYQRENEIQKCRQNND